MRYLIFALYILYIIVWATLSLVVMAVAALLSLPFDKERRAVLAISRVVARGIYFGSPVWKVGVEGADKCDPTKKYVIVANHQSFFDIPILFYLPLWKFKFVSKVEVRKIPAVGWMLGLRGDIVIRRGTAQAAQAFFTEGAEHLAAGTSVAVFPEGTRTKSGRVGRFKEGAFRLASECGADILPVVIEGTKGLLTKRGLTPRRLTVRVLEPIPHAEVAAVAPKELAERVREMMIQNSKF